jgi:DNA replication protein DnaC
MLRRGGVPLRHSEADTFGLIACQPWADAWSLLMDETDKGGLFSAIIGPRGTGKTQLAVEVAKRIAQIEAMKKKPDDRPIMYDKAMGVFVTIRQAMKGDDGELTAIRRYITPRLLIIDEIQERGETEWEDRVLTHILDKRYDDPSKNTLVLGNAKPEEIAKALGPSITSRIRECGSLIVCDWKGFR